MLPVVPDVSGAWCVAAPGGAGPARAPGARSRASCARSSSRPPLSGRPHQPGANISRRRS